MMMRRVRDLALLERAAEVLERAAAGGAPVLRLALEPLPLLRDLARLDRVGHHREGVAGRRHALEAEDLDRNRGPGLLHRLAALVVQRAHPAGELAADEVVADPQRALLHQDRGERALARIERGLEHGALRLGRRDWP